MNICVKMRFSVIQEIFDTIEAHGLRSIVFIRDQERQNIRLEPTPGQIPSIESCKIFVIDDVIQDDDDLAAGPESDKMSTH